MKKLLLNVLFTLCMILIVCQTSAQTQFWSDTFESSPSSGSRVPEVNGGTTSSYFRLTDGTNISQVVPFTGKQGTNYWAGEDHNGTGTGFPSDGATPANNPLSELQIEWTGINISGKSNMSFKGLIAAASTNEPWDNQTACVSGVGTTNTDYIIIEYSIDGGAYTNLIRFYNRGSASGTGDKYLFEDTNNDGCGDGIQLTNVFGEFTKTISGTGTIMNLRFRVFSEGNNEEWGIDDFRLFEGTSLSINEFNKQTTFSLYPNPSSHSINIQSQNEGDFQLLNTLGKVVKVFKVKANIETSVNVEGLSKGLYFVKSVDENKTQKLIIK